MHSVRAGVLHAVADDGAALQIRARGQNHSPRPVHRAGGERNGADRAVLCPHLCHLSLPHGQMVLQLQRVLHPLLILPAVRLRPERPDSGPLPQIQKAVLNAALVRRSGHFAPQRVQFPDKVPLAGAADGGIAGHIAHSVQIDGKNDGLKAKAGGGQRRLDAGVARADDSDIKLSGKKGIHSSILFSG